MDKDVLVAIAGLMSQVLWFVLIVGLLVVLRRWLKDDVRWKKLLEDKVRGITAVKGPGFAIALDATQVETLARSVLRNAALTLKSDHGLARRSPPGRDELPTFLHRRRYFGMTPTRPTRLRSGRY